MSETNNCPNCGAEHDREQGQFTFWECGAWRNNNIGEIITCDNCASRSALQRIYLTAEPGSLIQQIAADALGGGK